MKKLTIDWQVVWYEQKKDALWTYFTTVKTYEDALKQVEKLKKKKTISRYIEIKQAWEV